jgi:hypothetical protein
VPTADGKALYEKQRTALVRTNVVGVPLKDISELAPAEFVWAVLLFDLIRERYWVQQKMLPEVSYTGEMIVEPQALVGTGSSLVKSGQYKYLELPRLTAKDVTQEKTAAQWENKVTGQNAWMEKRYAHRVPEDFLNVVGEQQKLLLEQRAQKMLLPANAGAARTEDEPDDWHDASEPSLSIARRADTGPLGSLETVSPTWFGPKEKLERDRVWVARTNQMKAIQALAEEEFRRDAPAILTWVYDRARRNREAIFNACARGEWELPSFSEPPFTDKEADDVDEDGFHTHTLFGRTKQHRKDCLRQKQDRWHYYGASPKFSLGEFDNLDRHWHCAEKPEFRATIMTEILPDCPQALAEVLAVKVEDLPWPLQHFYIHEKYSGNHILDRLDPQDWVLQNPWLPSARNVIRWGRQRTGFEVNIFVAHSKVALNERRKKLKLPAKDWDKDLPRKKQKDRERW